jgi:chitin disaccharide deacetylase
VAKYLIVNADDFGRSPGIKRGTIAAYERGIVTSASLMVRWPAAVEAAAYSRLHPNFSVGLHVDLCEWTYREGTWAPLYEVVSLDDITAVAREVDRQLELFRRLVGRSPSHIDSHQHVHLEEPVRSVMCEAARDLAIPLRGCSPDVHYCGEFYGQTAEGFPYPDGISVDGLLRTLAALPPGVTELGCHPGDGDDLDAMYRRERAEEVQALCDARVRAAIIAEGLHLCSFHDVARMRNQHVGRKPLGKIKPGRRT